MLIFPRVTIIRKVLTPYTKPLASNNNHSSTSKDRTTVVVLSVASFHSNCFVLLLDDYPENKDGTKKNKRMQQYSLALNFSKPVNEKCLGFVEHFWQFILP